MCGVPVHPRRRISAPADRARPPRRGLRAARGSGGSAQARQQERGAARRGAAGDARHADRRHAARRAGATIICSPIARARLRRPARTPALRSPGSISRPANSASPNATGCRSRPRSRGWSRARSSSPTRFMPMPIWRRYWRTLPAVTPLTRDVFDSATAERRLTSFFAVATSEAFGTLTRLELTAAAACVTYVERTQIGKRPPLSPPLRESAGATMAIDQATRGNLELMRTLSGERRGSLLDCDRPHRHLGRLAPAGATTVGAAHRSGGDRTPARRGSELRRGRRGARRYPLAACRRRPISPARWRASPSDAAGRAISPPSATACSPPPSLPAPWRR